MGKAVVLLIMIAFIQAKLYKPKPRDLYDPIPDKEKNVRDFIDECPALCRMIMMTDEFYKAKCGKCLEGKSRFYPVFKMKTTLDPK
ncbi:unnamed protein product [Cylicocyclus nassatus]|uniref:Uncharacterized protein n=1 Tax=Cylicocyclus nassatus TaxID=53992 RepID=A0AA36DLT9_CYLNA|nr:unnamed protein product [Cylicocyclus nassatus]